MNQSAYSCVVHNLFMSCPFAQLFIYHTHTNISGLTAGMVYQPYPGKYSASDGTLFGVARIYDVASRNLCVERVDPDGKTTLFAGQLHAVQELAERSAYKACREYELMLPDGCIKFPLHVQESEIIATRLLRDLGYRTNENGDRVSGYFPLVEMAEKPDICAVVSLTEEIKGLLEEDHGYSVHLVDDISESLCQIYHTDELSKDSLVKLVKDITGSVLAAAKGNHQA